MAPTVLPGLRRMLGVADRQVHGLSAELPYKREFLRDIDIFRDLAGDDLLWLEQSTRMTTVRKGQGIYHQDDTAEGLYLVKQGRVRLSRHSAGGKKLDLALLEPGTFFGEMPLLGERMRHTSAMAVEDSVLCVMSQADIERLALRTPKVALRMVEVVSRRLAQSEARLEDLAYRSVTARLASVVLQMGRGHDDLIEGLTHQDLGDMVGACRETVTKTLDEFQAVGCIELARRRIRIRDRRALATFLDQ